MQAIKAGSDYSAQRATSFPDGEQALRDERHAQPQTQRLDRLTKLPEAVLGRIFSRLPPSDALRARAAGSALRQALDTTCRPLLAPAMFRAFAERRISIDAVTPYARGVSHAVCLPTRAAHFPPGGGPPVSPALNGDVLFSEAWRHVNILELGAKNITSLDVRHEGLLLRTAGCHSIAFELPQLDGLRSLVYSFGAGAKTFAITLQMEGIGNVVHRAEFNHDLFAMASANLASFTMRGPQDAWIGYRSLLPQLPSSLRHLDLFASDFRVGNDALVILSESRLTQLQSLCMRLSDAEEELSADVFAAFCASVGNGLETITIHADAQDELYTNPGFQGAIEGLIVRSPALQNLSLENLPFSFDSLRTTSVQPRAPLRKLRVLVDWSA